LGSRTDIHPALLIPRSSVLKKVEEQGLGGKLADKANLKKITIKQK